MRSLKCLECDFRYDGMREPACPECGSSGGFLQFPAMRIIEGVSVHLEEILVYPSKNEYKIKEIQDKGLMTILVSSPRTDLIGARCYISNNNFTLYTKKGK